MKKKGMLGAALAIGAASGIAYGAKKVVDGLRNLEEEMDQESFDALIKEQEVYDNVDGSMLMKWFQEKQARHPGKNMRVLAKVNQENADMFGFGRIPENFDSEHVLYQALIEEESDKVLESRMISFYTLSSVVSKGLEGKNYIFFT